VILYYAHQFPTKKRRKEILGRIDYETLNLACLKANDFGAITKLHTLAATSLFMSCDCYHDSDKSNFF